MSSNEESFRKGYEAFGKADFETLSGLMTDDTIWHAPGNNPLSGDYKGKEAVLGLFAKIGEESAGSFNIELHDLLANDEHGVALYTARGDRGGKHLENNGVHVAHFRDGKLAESWLHSTDQGALDEFWS
jgi:ketosteroid isomerase-like protein